jgi:hypothetical protein
MEEVATIAAICNRVARMLGTLDRAGLQRDIAIVQAHCPLDLVALAGSSDQVFIDELMSIIEAADREGGSLRSGFSSRFAHHPEAC